MAGRGSRQVARCPAMSYVEAIVLGIILLKFTKPDLGGSLLTIGVAIVLGLASALPVSRQVRTQEGSAD